MTDRKTFSTKERVAIFKRHKGICHMCRLPIQVGQAWEVSHDIPLELGGKDDASNWLPAHKVCHRDHTALVDQPAIAKTKRVEARHIGAVAPAQPIRPSPFPIGKGRKAHPIALPPRRTLYSETQG